MPKCFELSLRKLGLPSNTVSVFRKSEGPDILRDIDLSNEGTHIFVVPDSCASLIKVESLYSERIKGGTVYVA